MTTNYDKNELRRLDFEHFIHPFSDMEDIKAAGARVIVAGDG